MLSALGLSGSKKRWAPAAKLQKDGKMSKKQLMEYLEYSTAQISSAECVEAMCKLAKDNPDEQKKYVELCNDWQCQLIENRGFTEDFGRVSLDEWKNTAGTAGAPKVDPKVVEAFETFERALQFTCTSAIQLRHVRHTLQLDMDTGEDTGEAVMTRRTPKAEKLQTVGPVQRQKMIRFCEMARDLVLSFESRELIGNVMRDYSTWKQEKLVDLINKIILRWQFELWESAAIAVDMRLGMVELQRSIPHSGEEDFINAQRNMFLACQALTQWFAAPKPHKDSVPRAEGRKYEPFSLATEGFKEERAGALFKEGVMKADHFLKILKTVVETIGTEEHGQKIEEVAFASDPADLRAPERLAFELYEACGVEHRYALMLLVYYQVKEEVEQLTKDMGEAQKGIKTRMMIGLRKLQEAKKAGYANDKAAPLITDGAPTA